MSFIQQRINEALRTWCRRCAAPTALGLALMAVIAGLTAAAAMRPAAPEQLARLSNAANIAAITALPAPGAGGFSFAVLGDNRGGDEVYTQLLAQLNAYAAARSGGQRPLFALHTGDIVSHGRQSEWETYAQLRAGLNMPLVHVRGNHDIAAPEGPSLYTRLVGPVNWSFDFGGCRFIGLDNPTGRFDADSVMFLRARLGLDRPGAVISGAGMECPAQVCAVFHEPPDVGRWQVHSMQSDAQGGRGGEVMAALAQARAAGVFMGHLHLFDTMSIAGIPYLVSGGAGAPLYGKYGFGRPEHGFLVVHLQAGRLSWDWVPLAAPAAK